MRTRVICALTALIVALSCLPATAEEQITLRVSGAWEDCRAIDSLGRAFTSKYPNCAVEYEYIQNYTDAIVKRMEGDEPVDIFFTNNIQSNAASSELIEYALDLKSVSGLDLSNTFPGLVDNFMFIEADKAERTKLYAIPVGAEMRGLCVNKTLLSSLGLDVPTNQSELLNACAVLKEHGYIPFQGNPARFGQLLIYPWVSNLIANAEDPAQVYAEVDARTADFKALLREPVEFLYSLVENYYYDYKRAQTDYNLFTEDTDIMNALNFFNIVKKDGEWVKADDVGIVAFMPQALSIASLMEKTKDDYHSGIDYVFVPAPVSDQGGFAYMSPAHGIAVNKLSKNVDWSVKFINFMFMPENTELFCKEFGAIPNNKDAFEYVSSLYDIPDGNISHLGEVTFTYDFYKIVRLLLTDVSKANNPKYMKQLDDGTTELYPLEYYLNALEENLKTQ